ncbi:MAG: 3'(2'),5'-bisphosphate nucleotidase CysQ [Bacteroidaceae bacterium]
MEMRILLRTALLASLEAGEEIMHIYSDPIQDFGIERKADNSPLTLADKASHQVIMRYLLTTDIPVLSEEGQHLPYEERSAWERLWVVDPLDGTKEFIKKNGEFTVNIALVVHGNPILGVVYVPAARVLYYGIVGEGAWRCVVPAFPNGLPEPEGLSALLSSDGPSDPDAPFGGVVLPVAEEHDVFTIVASRSHMSPETQTYIQEMERLHGQVKTVSSGSSIKICLVAEGVADAYPRYAPTMEWDTAAGDAVARAAGKIVISVETGTPLVYNKQDLHNPWFLVES